MPEDPKRFDCIAPEHCQERGLDQCDYCQDYITHKHTMTDIELLTDLCNSEGGCEEK